MRFQTHLCQSHLHRGHYAEISASWAPVCEHVGLKISYLKTYRSTPVLGLSNFGVVSCSVLVVWLGSGSVIFPHSYLHDASYLWVAFFGRGDNKSFSRGDPNADEGKSLCLRGQFCVEILVWQNLRSIL